MVSNQLQASILKQRKCTSKRPSFSAKEMLKLTLPKAIEPKMNFSKLMIVEIHTRNVICLTVQPMKKKESQKEFLLEKFRTKETDQKK
jgi:hypothetical protein